MLQQWLSLAADVAHAPDPDVALAVRAVDPGLDPSPRLERREGCDRVRIDIPISTSPFNSPGPDCAD